MFVSFVCYLIYGRYSFSVQIFSISLWSSRREKVSILIWILIRLARSIIVTLTVNYGYFQLLITVGSNTPLNSNRLLLHFTWFMYGVKRSIHVHCVVLVSQFLLSQVGSLFFFPYFKRRSAWSKLSPENISHPNIASSGASVASECEK